MKRPAGRVRLLTIDEAAGVGCAEQHGHVGFWKRLFPERHMLPQPHLVDEVYDARLVHQRGWRWPANMPTDPKLRVGLPVAQQREGFKQALMVLGDLEVAESHQQRS